MEHEHEKNRRFGLIGKNISYSFSKKYFTDKFEKEEFTDCSYENFDLQTIAQFPKLIRENANLIGLNVTIPYKEKIIPFLDKLNKKATKIGAVNCIKIAKNGKLKGYNTDYFGFKKSLEPLLQPHHQKALILGTGGASKAVAFALEELGILYTFVSRSKKEDALDYKYINATTFDNYQLIINCTPLGTHPNLEEFPPIPYDFFTEEHIAFDLIYNPEETEFLKRAKAKNAVTKNGYEMLVLQAEKGWKIWNK
ncbi:shikimate dehydrogenase [Flavobacterium azooxidireducens]|uniref:Shikimate dehydrogenase n=1 Tax=Flavobacterium azooxidireducens TaxID=1871076 RepID=A0ABY4KBU2_9FLAO|nr:shikimate dehydrogenase [Flavobacterium azooxidireducens]UPQ78256.1 shikimate dehydrogenase [Flavobacterium azooxidireducens]